MSAVFPCSWNDRTHEEVVVPCCPACEEELVLHQPDPGLPHRLLAVCEACKAWYVSDAEGGLLIPIPTDDRRHPRRRGHLG